MSNNPSVNRALKDDAMDHIDHALGRPVDPLRESRRNYFAVDAESKLAEQFFASPNWEKVRHWDDMIRFQVTEAGRKALSAHLKEIKDPYRAFEVTIKPSRIFGEGFTTIVVAKSNGAAKYAAYLSASDGYCDLTFKTFLTIASARLAQVGTASP